MCALVSRSICSFRGLRSLLHHRPPPPPPQCRRRLSKPSSCESKRHHCGSWVHLTSAGFIHLSVASLPASLVSLDGWRGRRERQEIYSLAASLTLIRVPPSPLGLTAGGLGCTPTWHGLSHRSIPRGGTRNTTVEEYSNKSSAPCC